jgi:Sulfocyanin (SoxE) domain
MSLLVAATAGLSAAGCSKSPDDSPRVETAATASVAAQPAAVPETTATAVDSPKTATPRAVNPPRRKPVVEPASAKQLEPSADSTPAAAPAQDKNLSYDAATNTVTFELIAGPFTFNGYRNGGATLVVPAKANMVINFVNKDGTPHSAIVISGDGPIPNSATDPAIPRAYTNKVLEGLPQEGSDVMRFPMPDTGTYRIFCGVPGHGLSGMWIWLKADPAAKAPSLAATKG